MKNLSNNIYTYYVQHFSELPFDKQLHFASRLFLWSEDNFGKQILDTLRAEVTADEHPDVALRAVHTRALETIHHGSKNAAALRAPYFEQYPELRPLAMVLFRLTFLQTIYEQDATSTFLELFDTEQVEAMLSKLQADEKALAVLSTHAVNTLYLYSRVVRKDTTLFNPALFLHVGQTQYDLDDPIELQLYIYLYTHCIIGESVFYKQKLPAESLPVYQTMLDELERELEARFEQINLDNKFEFLVCCKLVGKISPLTERIEAEAVQSISDQGTFLVDTHNNNPQTANNTLDLSEHRNVLYIMAHLPTRLA